MDAMKLLTALTLRSPQNSNELIQLGVAELIVQAMKVHSNDEKHQVSTFLNLYVHFEFLYLTIIL